MALVWNKTDLPTLAEKKLEEVNAACESIIYAGLDVDLSVGKKHFSLTPNDQTNLDSMFSAITLGAAEYPYHADGEQCMMYSAVDIMTLYVAYKEFITYQTTYCNMLRTWIKRETDNSVIGGVYYGITLPDDLKADMTSLLQSASAQIQAIIERMQATYQNL